MSGAIDGIISGFNTSEIIDTIMRYEHQRVDLYSMRQTEYTNKLTSWKSVEALLVGFKLQASLLSNESLWYAKSASSSDESVIMVSSSADATPGTYFLSVNQLATHHQVACQGIGSLTQSLGSGTISIQVGSVSPTIITVDSSNNTLSALKDAINDSDAGVTAAVINDGSYHNPYRLVLTAKDPGADSRITVTTSLNGGTSPDFSTPQFDLAEKISWSDEATSNPLLSSSASYTGMVNKTYTFTVGGTGLQTVGNGDIEVNWTDGTNSGTITVSAADTDIALTGDGADGLVVSFSTGDLQAGDSFQIQAFAPTIQNSQDAIVQLGSSENGGSPILMYSSSNTITDLIEGVTLELRSTSNGEPVEIIISEDRSQIKSQIREFVNKFNEYQDFVDSQFSYELESNQAGVLLGDVSLMMLHNDLRSTISSIVEGRPDTMKMLSQAGIKFDSNGKLTFDESIFNQKIEDNYNDLVRLFKSSGTTNNALIEYVSSSASTKVSTTGYQVDITQAATRGSFVGTSITDPSDGGLTLDSSNNIIKVTVNGIVSGEIALTQKTYTSGDELAQEIEDAINNDSNLSGIGVDVEWVDNENTGNFVIYTRTYGSNSTVTFDSAPENSAHGILGFSGGVAATGQDVQGTINGEEATGVGQFLTGNDGNENTAGLKLLITISPDQLVDGAEGIVYFNKGIAEILDEKISLYIDPHDGTIKGKKDALQNQIDNVAEHIESMEEQLERKRISLYQQFIAMEDALAKLQTQQQFLTAQINNLNQINQMISSMNTNN